MNMRMRLPSRPRTRADALVVRVLCCVLAGLPAAAIAQSTETTETLADDDPALVLARQDLQRMDRDGDGRVSSGEHADAAKAAFDVLDADRDYRVDAAEMEAANGNQPVAHRLSGDQRLKPLDSNGDGELSPDEQADRAEAGFQARDTDDDGFLDLRELRDSIAPPAAPPQT